MRALTWAGDLMLFGGFVSCLIWTVLTVAVVYVYFVFLPAQYAEKGEQMPVWLQDIGSFEVEADLGKVGEGTLHDRCTCAVLQGFGF
jgi:hypothetical protein